MARQWLIELSTPTPSRPDPFPLALQLGPLNQLNDLNIGTWKEESFSQPYRTSINKENWYKNNEM